MKEKIKGLRLNITISAVISIIIGVLLMAFPTETTEVLSRIIAGIIILAGVAIIISQIFENSKNVMGIVVGAILAILGIWMFMSPKDNIFINIIPIAIGVILVVHGVQDLGMAFEVLKTKQGGSLLLFIGAIVNIVLGLFFYHFLFHDCRINNQSRSRFSNLVYKENICHAVKYHHKANKPNNSSDNIKCHGNT